MQVSVIVTTHNRPSYLSKVLDGYLRQTKAPQQIVVADDGSDDETRSLVRAFQARAPFEVVHAWQPHAGTPRLSHVRNLATRATTGEYLIYTDGDCVPTKHFVADHARLARPRWFVQGKRMWIRYKALDEFTGAESVAKMLQLAAIGGLTKAYWLLHLPGIGPEVGSIDGVRSCNLGVYRDDVQAINGWNEAFVGFWRQDSEFCLRLVRSGVRRRDAVFSAMVFHLEHEKPKIQADLQRNDRLLAEAETAPIYTPLGLHQEAESRGARAA